MLLSLMTIRLVREVIVFPKVPLGEQGAMETAVESAVG